MTNGERSLLTKFGKTVKKATTAKMIHEVESMKLVGLMSRRAAEAIRPITANRNIRKVCSKYGLPLNRLVNQKYALQIANMMIRLGSTIAKVANRLPQKPPTV